MEFGTFPEDSQFRRHLRNFILIEIIPSSCNTSIYLPLVHTAASTSPKQHRKHINALPPDNPSKQPPHQVFSRPTQPEILSSGAFDTTHAFAAAKVGGGSNVTCSDLLYAGCRTISLHRFRAEPHAAQKDILGGSLGHDS